MKAGDSPECYRGHKDAAIFVKVLQIYIYMSAVFEFDYTPQQAAVD